VVVCDGFVGNIVLKFTEGIVGGLFETIVAELQRVVPQLAGQFSAAMEQIYNRYDWQEYGGAPLLGVNGYCLICHGRSQAKAIKNAIRVAKQLTAGKLNDTIVQRIKQATPSNGVS
jgi:glycerol-3-phosphate acyltransferase PlsX